MNAPLAGKRALITGSTQGIGLAVARRLAASGADIVLHGLGETGALDALGASLAREFGVRVVSSSADLRDPERITRLIAEATGALGGVDILVNNAVVRHSAPVDAFTPEAWDESLAVNLSAAFHAIRLTVPAMRQRQWGRIVNVSSIYGLRGAAHRIGYVTTKTALIGLTRGVALDTIADGITCNAVCPGTTETPIHQASVDALTAAQGASRAEAERIVLAGKQPTARFVAPDGVAGLIEFLCGADAADITGAVIPIDGAWSAS